jgi:uncharacterized coiled-coil DUF342 family protein
VVLRFLVAATAANDPLRAWAERELTEVNGDIERLTKERDQTHASFKAAAARAKALQDEVIKAQDAIGADSPKVRALNANLAAAREQVQRTEAAATQLNEAIGKHEPIQ